MDFVVEPEEGHWIVRGATQVWRCAIGRAGVTATKREGDGATPVGAWPLRRVLFRPDRTDPPETRLPTRPLSPSDGWCDDPGDPAYNLPVTLPHPARHERLWREDAIYDVIVVLGHNDDPPVAGLGSAIFLHVARPDYAPTEGCVALSLPHLRELLRAAPTSSRLRIAPGRA